MPAVPFHGTRPVLGRESRRQSQFAAVVEGQFRVRQRDDLEVDPGVLKRLPEMRTDGRIRGNLPRMFRRSPHSDLFTGHHLNPGAIEASRRFSARRDGIADGLRKGQDIEQAAAEAVLLDLAKTGNPKYRIRALRKYIGIARQLDVPLNNRIMMCAQALSAATRSQEKRLVLEVLRRYPTAEGLQLAIRLLAEPELKAEAADSAVQIAEKLPKANAPIVARAMDQVIQAGVSAEITQKAQAIRKQVGQ
ncbi:MAG: hypothetical protein ACUVTH_14325 [Thermogutta sp.]